MATPDAAPILSVATLSMMGGLALTTAYLTWFISDQFSKNRRLFYRVISRHNREDDDRFEVLNDSIWKIHLRNAERDGDKPPHRHPIVRRRYLLETGDETSDDLDGDGPVG